VYIITDKNAFVNTKIKKVFTCFCLLFCEKVP